MKRLMVIAAAVASFFGVGMLIAAPAAQAAPVGPCATGILIHLQIGGADVLNLCI